MFLFLLLFVMNGSPYYNPFLDNPANLPDATFDDSEGSSYSDNDCVLISTAPIASTSRRPPPTFSSQPTSTIQSPAAARRSTENSRGSSNRGRVRKLVSF